MTNESQIIAQMMDRNRYRNNLSSEEMQKYLSDYPDMAWAVAKSCPDHRMLALSVDWHAFKYIKKSEQTLEEVMLAISQDGRSIEWVSRRILKKEPYLYNLAVHSNGLAIQYVPEELRYEGIYEDAIRSNAESITLVPEEELTRDLIMLALRGNGLLLRYIPKRRINKEMAHVAFESDARAIEYIPDRFLDNEMVLLAVSVQGSLLEYISPKLLDKDVVTAAVYNDGNALKYVPLEFIDENIASIAVGNTGNALKYVPPRLITLKMCRMAVADVPISLRYVPPRYFNDDIIKVALRGDWRLLRYVSGASDSILEVAIEESPLALEFFPNRRITPKICESACQRDPQAIQYVPRKLVSASMLRGWLASFFGDDGEVTGSPSLNSMKALMGVNKDQLRDPIVANLMRKLGNRETKSAKWVKKSSTFLVSEVITCGTERRFLEPSTYSSFEDHLITFNITTRVKNLDELCELLGGDLAKVEFRDYSFNDYDPERHDLSTADIPVDTLKRIGAYDDSAYRKLVAMRGSVPEVRNPVADESLAPVIREEMILPSQFEAGKPFYYVSDLHLNHRLKNKFPKEATERQIRDYLSSLARSMVETAPETDRKSTLIVLGDTSYSIDVAEIFFKALRAHWQGRIVCILGNHELWDWTAQRPSERKTPTLSSVVAKYADMLKELSGVWLLQNEALILHRDMRAYYLSEAQLKSMDDNELRDVLYRCSYIVLGGIGFTGYCDSFNAEHGIYRDAITNRSQDIALSDEFSTIHERIRCLAPRANVIVATHTPMSNWSVMEYHPGWVYLNGHTHRNTFIEFGDVRVYADNQIGYSEQNAGLRRFYVEGLYDPFRHLPDGIHEVTRIDYLDFNRCRSIDVELTRKGQILMLKRESVYLFLFKWEETGKLYLLEGGAIRNLEEQDPNYYYDRMILYSRLVKKAFASYESDINTIADEVKSFGGSGKVHGCIVDIDFFNHVYLDPFTGELTFYYATSVVDRFEYPSLEKLLTEELPSLLPAYVSLLQSRTDTEAPIVVRGVDPESLEILHKTDSLMYKPSNVIRTVQYLFDSNVIRVWNEEALALAQDEGAMQSGINNDRSLQNATVNVSSSKFIG